jgi:hypothetical protein
MKRREPQSITIRIRYGNGESTQEIPLQAGELHSITIEKGYEDGSTSSLPIYPTPDYVPRTGPELPSPWKER